MNKMDNTEEQKLSELRALNNSIDNVSTQKIITENPDSIEIGTPGKGGAIKVYGNFDNIVAFGEKIENAIKVRDIANQKLAQI